MQVDAREGARKLSGGLIAVLGAAFALVMVGAFTLLDYRFQQDEHRLVKILIGVAGLGLMCRTRRSDCSRCRLRRRSCPGCRSCRSPA
jgi:hypothetical protein